MSLAKPRHSGIPAPGKSSLPTPGRLRSSSNIAQPSPGISDIGYASRAFADAVKANDPAQHRVSDVSPTSLPAKPISFSPRSGRRSVSGRVSSAASLPSTSTSPLPRDPLESDTLHLIRPPSRYSDISGRSESRQGKPFESGESVRIESLGYEGTLRFVGEIEGKPGLWAGVELTGGFAGKGKNDGSFNR
jgi:CAP-Gly domain-containing linker protein 1